MTASPTLAQVFDAHRSRAWYFVNPGGNWGDDLIYAGADQLAEQMGITPARFNFRNFVTANVGAGAAIYLHGGGGFNPWCSGRAFDILRQALAVDGATVVQGPHTCSTFDGSAAALLGQTFQGVRATEVWSFAREAETFRYLQSALPRGARLGLDHDTALHLTPQRVLALAGMKKPVTSRYRLVVSREDDEAPGTARSVSEGDSTAGGVVLDPARYASSFGHWLRIHLYATSIVTNRLHSAILGSVLGKPVTLHAGSYHKNRSVWEFSLKPRGVLWSDVPLPGPVDLGRHRGLPTFLSRSWKVQRALMRLKGVPTR